LVAFKAIPMVHVVHSYTTVHTHIVDLFVAVVRRFPGWCVVVRHFRCRFWAVCVLFSLFCFLFCFCFDKKNKKENLCSRYVTFTTYMIRVFSSSKFCFSFYFSQDNIDTVGLFIQAPRLESCAAIQTDCIHSRLAISFQSAF
jgi:hypothetical protein